MEAISVASELESDKMMERKLRRFKSNYRSKTTIVWLTNAPTCQIQIQIKKKQKKLHLFPGGNYWLSWVFRRQEVIVWDRQSAHSRCSALRKPLLPFIWHRVSLTELRWLLWSRGGHCSGVGRGSRTRRDAGQLLLMEWRGTAWPGLVCFSLTQMLINGN